VPDTDSTCGQRRRRHGPQRWLSKNELVPHATGQWRGRPREPLVTVRGVTHVLVLLDDTKLGVNSKKPPRYLAKFVKPPIFF
jgi:hypothetical protein